ncbi:MAG: crossover junction endodeoxyribonuclease RuvC [Symploca sp. SIO2D2]|nr:crossover junction endodeoxyribonuclease RuvC [Symploca sp. SIO2D2]
MELDNFWLGLDPGLARIGWSVVAEDNDNHPHIVDYGTIQTNKNLTTPQRLVEIEQDLVELLKEFEPDNVALEMPFFNRQIKAAGGVLQAVGIINLVCYREAGLVPVALHQASWKAHLGNGRATKNEVAEIIQTLFDLKKLPIDDTVDAVGIAYAGMCGLTNNIS